MQGRDLNDAFYWDSVERQNTDRSWVSQAECRGMDTSLFFPTVGVLSKQVKGVCARCKVQAECNEYGKEERYGFWGGEGRRRRRKAVSND